ncbi:MAG: hypothetical protein FWH32_07985 [Clostridiales bacterium]|nr:hypothetical protein [Clostridiales bacterium]
MGLGGAGIGGGNRGAGGTIAISGSAEVEATGGSNGAGIGGGNGSGGGGNGGEIAIEGGTVTAQGVDGGAGIGGGLNGDGGTIAISGGTVEATGGDGGAGIGGGLNVSTGGASVAGGDITISGGTITATAGAVGGTGEKAPLALGNGMDGSDGTVTVTGLYDYWVNDKQREHPGGNATFGVFADPDATTFATDKGYLYVKLEDLSADSAELATLSLSPTHAVLTNKSDAPAVVSAVTAPEGFFDFRRVSWDVDGVGGSLGVEYDAARDGSVITVSEGGANGVDVATVTVAADRKTAAVRPADAWINAPDTDRKAHTIRVRIDYDRGLYTSTATIELVPDASLPVREGDGTGLHTSVRVLEPTVAVNRAMARGALVPILITQHEPTDMGLVAFSDDGGVGALDEPEQPMPSLPAIGAMRLVTGTAASPRVVAGYEVKIAPDDDRFLEITAEATARNTKNVRLQILRAGINGSGENGAVVDADWADEAKRVPVTGQFNLTVSNKFPKVTLRAGDLNLLFPNVGATVTATSTAGAVDVLNIDPSTLTFKTNIELRRGGNLPPAIGNLPPVYVGLKLQPDTENTTAPVPVLTKAGTQRGRATVQVEGFKTQEVAMNVRVVNAAPNVRLARNSVALHYPGESIDGLPTVPDPADPNKLLKDDFAPAVVNLISGVRNGVFEDGYKVKRVEINHTNPDQFNLRIEPYNVDEPGVVKLTPLGAVPKNVPLRVVFHDPAFGDDQTNLDSNTKFRNIGNLKVTMRAVTALNVTNKATPVAVNRNHVSRLADGSPDEYETEWIIREIPIGLNADNIILGDWKAQSISETSKTRTPWLGENILDGNGEPIPPVRVEPYKSGIKLYAHKAALEDLMERGKTKPYDATINPRNMTYRMLIGSDKIRNNSGVRTFAVNLTFNAGNPTFTVSLNSRTRIDVANPASFQTATVRLTGTTAEIASVKLYPTAKNNADRPTESTDFIAEVTGASTFNIAKHPDNSEVVPKVRQNLSVQITLTNGQILNSWTEVKNGKNKDRTIGVTALQAVQRATSRTVTLYRAQPLQEAVFDAFIGTPAGASVGYYTLDQARLDAIRFGKPVLVTENGTTSIEYVKYGNPDNTHHRGLTLVRTGETSYALSFEDGIAPGAILHRNYPTNKTTTKLNSNYPIRVELWAEGTYKVAKDENGDIIIDEITKKPRPELDPDTGKVVPLQNPTNKRPVTAPTVYNVRLNLR